MGIFTPEMVNQAVELATPAILKLLATPGMTWGPQWVEGVVSVPGIDREFRYIIGEVTPWQKSWGKKMDFNFIATQKHTQSEREQLSTREIVKLFPWLVEDGEFLYVGGVFEADITVVLSGALGTTDEAGANIILTMLKMLAYHKAEKREKEKDMQV